MVGFFSYYLTVRGYRILSLKKLHLGQRPEVLDWIITGTSGTFILILLGWGIWQMSHGIGMGIVAVVFGVIGSTFLIDDMRRFFIAPKEKMHWWYGHINSMGGSYIAAVTAFVVVNIQLPQHNWVLWVIPSVIGSMMIARTIRKYKIQFGVIREEAIN